MSTETHDMFGMWKREELNTQKDKLDNLRRTLKSLNNKGTSYARGIAKMILLREKIIEQFDLNYEDLLLAQEQKLSRTNA